MKKTVLAIAVVSQLPCAFYSYADSSNADTMVVTANRFEQKIKETIEPVEVITKQDINAIQATSLVDVLKHLPGVQIANQGGLGQSAELYLQGRSSSNTLFLLNGIRIGSATSGSTDLSAIPLKGIERIEVLRGPRAAVYGSDAVSGVVNLITTASPSNRSGVSASVGSNKYFDTNAYFSVADDVSWLNMSVTHQQNDGFDVKTNSPNIHDSDNDGVLSQYILADVGRKLSDSLTLKLNGYYQRKNSDYDYGQSSNGADQTDSDLYNVGLITEYKVDPSYQSHLTVATNQDSAEFHGQGATPNTISTNRDSFSWDNRYKLNQVLVVTGGFDWYRDRVDNGSIEYLSDKRRNTAGYLGGYLSLGDFSAEGNIRRDKNSAYGYVTTNQIASAYRLSDDLRITMSYGESFKAPTFNQLYWPTQCFGSGGCYSGNPSLVPEKTKTSELAFEGTYYGAELRLAAYRSRVKDMIDSLSNENVDRVDIQGMEFVSKFETGSLYHTVVYDFLDAKNSSTDKQLRRRARHSVKWDTEYLYGAWQVKLSYLFQGKRYEDTRNQKVLGGYGLVDLATSYMFDNGVKVGGRVANLLDREYQTALGYNTADREYYLNISYDL
ncbi:TonB-dependent receptor domain-containing protein [Vibrio gazogenes]|uniref:Vitamin B12 transporter n=1 Tax=Vibrio gazogenes DSM 21264 = NBRC 103151 TaxID=1123492 RepID=A0A1M5HGC6_VIBGA|nr:TonB-dependent receptor [Vibrio gazogenes]USP13585.1 TonB-dependent receptor [Vibrio gazogenes]SHG14977.1 vitamin B12 transporter [Vibrio gazogenes DSM 21264] [Vibrio gazogenes DSM 21264 = NBRC 103151]SJN55599.1 Vitamin B12 transporter BtuB precursor [Vibrio gazogenes]